MPEETFEIKLEAYIDGQLPDAERAAFERQLAASPRHRRIVEQLMQTRHLIATLPRVRAPADLLESIDPSLERAALFDEGRPEPRFRLLVSPQGLALAATVALAATLVVGMLWLMPRNGGSVAQDRPDPRAATATNQDNISDNVSRVPDESQDDSIKPMPAEEAVADGGQDAKPTTVPGAEKVADAGGAQPEEPVAPVLPESVARAVLVSASVSSIPQASGTVSQFLTAADLPIDAQRLPVSALPPEVRSRISLADDTTVQVFLVDELSLEQVGTLTTELAADGRASALAPASFVAERRPVADQPPPGEQQQNIYQDDQLQLLIQRTDDPPTEPPAGIPVISQQQLLEVQVTSDGYADFGKIGLGRVDVLGKLASEVAQLVSDGLRGSYKIEADVQVMIAARGMPQVGRNHEAIRLVYLDREPLKTGDLVQVELPDGAWLHAAVDAQGLVQVADFDPLEALGRSVAQVQESLHEQSLARAVAEAEAQGRPLTTDRAPRPMRVVNLTARRAEGVDSWARQKTACLIVLSEPASAKPTTSELPTSVPAESEPADDL